MVINNNVTWQAFLTGVSVKTPVVILVWGGDRNTLSHVAKAVPHQIPVIILKKSGKIADMLAGIYEVLAEKEEEAR